MGGCSRYMRDIMCYVLMVTVHVSVTLVRIYEHIKYTIIWFILCHICKL